MINTLYLPELREMLAQNDAHELKEFCEALHPVRTAEFMEGLTSHEAWQVIQHADPEVRVDIFSFFDPERQLEILESEEIDQVAELVAQLPPDDQVDLLQALEPERRNQLLKRLPLEDRRDFQRLSQYPEDTAGAMMTTEFVKLAETLSIREALNELAQQSDYETIYYLYIVDDDDHLRGVVSARQLLVGMKQPETPLSQIMETDLITADVLEDQESVANKVAKMDLLAIPVVDDQHTLLGIITHDDVIDVLQEEAVEDAHRSAAVEPLDESYLRTSLVTLAWKRGVWLGLLFFFSLLTAFALEKYEAPFKQWVWLLPFIPLITSSGGNTGSQSATLIITALSRGHISMHDWLRVIARELMMGVLLGGGLALLGLAISYLFVPTNQTGWAILVVPITLLSVVICGSLNGSILPLIFKKLGLDPAMMSNPFVAGINDILGILIYVHVALYLLG